MGRPLRLLVRTAMAGFAATVVAGCASFDGRPLSPGASREEIETLMGAPDGVVAEPDGTTTLQYPRGPGGQATYMARLDAQGRLARIDQVLDAPFFNRVQPGAMRTDDIRRLFGRPYTQVRYPLMRETAWDYRYRENAQDMLFVVQFDDTGVVTRWFRIIERYPIDGPDGGSMGQ